MLKRLAVYFNNFIYKKVLKNILRLSRLGYGFIVAGAESGENFEHIYNNRPAGSFIIGKVIDRALLNLPSVQATRSRKEDIKQLVWNIIANNKLRGERTYILDLASGGARYLRELFEEHNRGDVMSLCIDKDKKCIQMGRRLSKAEGVQNLKFLRADVFRLHHLKYFAELKAIQPHIIIASGFFIYFNNNQAERMLREIYTFLPRNGFIIFQSYEKLSSRKLMRKTSAVSSGDSWTLYYRSPDYWRNHLSKIGFQDIFILRDKWKMNNVVTARK